MLTLLRSCDKISHNELTYGRILQLRCSNYNIFFKHKNKDFAFNSITRAFADVDSNFMKAVDVIENTGDCSALDEALVADMKKGGFIVDDCFDELQYLKFRSYRSKFSKNVLGMTIAPTLACNFSCPYCYEYSKPWVMKQDVMDAIYNRVKKSAEDGQAVRIVWYGGEPLLAKEVIWSLSKRIIEVCDKNDVKYSAYIVTNGYLIDDTTVENFKKFRIDGAQITVDGSPEIHNSRRKLKNSNEPTFDRIINNIKKLDNAGIKVTVRINVDKTNISRIEETLDIFAEHGLQNCVIYLGFVQSLTEACKSIESTCLQPLEYSLKQVEYSRMLAERGFNIAHYPQYPKSKSNFCCADSINSYVISYDGSMYRCWHDLGVDKKSVGNIKNEGCYNQQQFMTSISYLLSSPFENETCVKCKLLPICMGGCPSYRNEKDQEKCVIWKYNLIDTLKMKYDYSNAI